MDSSNRVVQEDPVFGCNPDGSNGVIPNVPECPHVNTGIDLGLDRSPFVGEDSVCGPDIGGNECVSEACLNACAR